MKTNTSEFDFWDWLLLFGGMWMLTEIFKTPTQAGIGALPDARRKIIYYTAPDGTRLFDEEAKKLTAAELGELIRLTTKARLMPGLTEPTFKRFTGSKYIDAELRDVQRGWRIFIKIIDDETLFAASFYKKQTGKAPKHEIEKAETRVKEYLQHIKRS